MSRHHPTDISAILAAAETWQTDCLIGDGSVFGVGETWTSENVDALFNAYSPQIDPGEDVFLEKLEEQLQGLGPVALLCAEILWVMYLFPVASHTEPQRKRTIISRVASWSGTRVEPSHRLLAKPLELGIGNPGSAYDKRRWTELAYFIKVLRDIKRKPSSERRNLMAFPWAFGRYLDDLAGDSKPVLTHMLRFLLFPERYEPIFSRGDKRRIVAAFCRIAAKDTQSWSTTQLDRELLKIRKEQVAAHGSQALSFFHDPLLSMRKELEKAQASKRTAQAADAVMPTTTTVKPGSALPVVGEDDAAEPVLPVNDTVEYSEVIDPYSVLGESNVGEIVHPPKPPAAPEISEADHPPERAPAEAPISYPLNQILCGAPGTGKTYLAMQRAVEICDGSAPADRADLMSRYRALESEQRIRFVTFHESYNYQDFVEGMRPELEAIDGESGARQTHVCKPGILKQMANRARQVGKATGGIFHFDRTRTIWKLSLRGTTDERKVFDDAISGGFVTLSYGEGVDFSHCTSREDVYQRMVKTQPSLTIADYSVSAMHYFSANMQPNDLVVISDGNAKFRAIGRITGAYQQANTDLTYDYQQLRSVEWLATYSPSLPFEKISTKQFSQRALYKLDSTILNLDAMERLASTQPSETPENYVLIVDEIDRGNVAQVFGELISLLEEDKREGAANALCVVLPCSNENFSLPPSLYLIGTMSSAIGSAKVMDPALRRRFAFEEMLPDATLIPGADAYGNISDDNGTTISLRSLLDTLNQRIQQAHHRDGLIGHSYFMPVKTTEQLERVINHQVLPTLQACFQDDADAVERIIKEILPAALGGSAAGPQWGSVDSMAGDPTGPIIQ